MVLGLPRTLAAHSTTIAVLGQVVPENFVRIFVYGTPQVTAEVFWSLETTSAQYLPNIEGAVYLAGNIQPLFKGMLDTEGQVNWLLQLPQSSELSGKTIYLQALLDRDGKPFVSRLTKVRFE